MARSFSGLALGARAPFPKFYLWRGPPVNSGRLKRYLGGIALQDDRSRLGLGIESGGKWHGSKKRKPGAGCVGVTTGWRRRREFPPAKRSNRSPGPSHY